MEVQERKKEKENYVRFGKNCEGYRNVSSQTVSRFDCIIHGGNNYLFTLPLTVSFHFRSDFAFRIK